MFRVGIIAVPERKEIMKVITDELDSKGIKYDIFMDEEHRGIKYNFNRLVEFYCTNKFEENIIITDDDIRFKEGWLEKATEVMNETDYDVVCMFTNQRSKPNDVCNIRRATAPYFFYEVGAIFRRGTFNEEFLKDFKEYSIQPQRCIKEINHPDNMMSTFLFNSKYKCGTVRPNYIELQNVPSTLGHKIVIKEN